MTEGLDAPLRVDHRGFAGREHDTARADRSAHPPRLHHAAADGCGGVVATTGGNRQTGRHSDRSGDRRRDLAGDVRALVYGGQPFDGDLETVQHICGPCARAEIEQERPGCIRRVGGELASQPKADEVLGQQDVADGSISVGFFVTQPQDFWSLKSSDGGIARDFEQSLTADLLIDGFALACGSLVVPEQGGPDDLARAVEEDGPMHLTREAERHWRRFQLGGDAAEHGLARRPPPLRILFGPTGPGRLQRIFLDGGGQDIAIEVDGERARTRGADVEPDQHQAIRRTSSGVSSWMLGSTALASLRVSASGR